MAFDDEQKQELNDILAGFGKGLVEQLSSQMNTGLSGLAKRLIADEMPKMFDGKLSAFEEQFKTLIPAEDRQRELLRSELNAILAELAEEEALADGPTNSGQSTVETHALAELRQQLAESNKMFEQMKARLTLSEKQAMEERQQREKLAAEQRLQSMREEVITQIRGKVKPNTERQLLQLLEMEGRLVEDKDTNRFMVKGKDELGFDANFPVEQQIAQLIDQNYAHFKEVRPGTGSGADSRTTTTSIQPGNYQYLQAQNGKVMLSDEAIAQAAASGKFDDLLREVAQAG